MYALIASAVVLVGGQIAVWRLYESSFGRTMGSTPGVLDSPRAPFVVGVGRIHGGPSEWMTFAKVFAQLQRDLGRPVVLRYALDSSESVDLLNRGDVDIALVSANAYLKAQRGSRLSLIVAPLAGDAPTDSIVMVVGGKSGIESLEDLRGRRLLLPPDALAGRPFVRWVFERRGDSRGAVKRWHRGEQRHSTSIARSTGAPRARRRRSRVRRRLGPHGGRLLGPFRR